MKQVLILSILSGTKLHRVHLNMSIRAASVAVGTGCEPDETDETSSAVSASFSSLITLVSNKVSLLSGSAFRFFVGFSG